MNKEIYFFCGLKDKESLSTMFGLVMLSESAVITKEVAEVHE